MGPQAPAGVVPSAEYPNIAEVSERHRRSRTIACAVASVLAFPILLIPVLQSNPRPTTITFVAVAVLSGLSVPYFIFRHRRMMSKIGLRHQPIFGRTLLLLSSVVGVVAASAGRLRIDYVISVIAFGALLDLLDRSIWRSSFVLAKEALPTQPPAGTARVDAAQRAEDEGADDRRFFCKVCRYQSADRVRVFNHIKQAHTEVHDRNAEIGERT